MVNRRPGRPTGAPSARQALLDAARAHLVAGDLADLSSRELAREADVSHTLVNYHFGSRDALISAAISEGIAPHDVVSLSRGADGRIDLARLAHGILAAWEHPEHGARLVESARRLASADAASATIARYLQDAVFTPLVADFGIEHARRITTTIVGFLFARYVLALPILAALSREEAGRMLLAQLR